MPVYEYKCSACERVFEMQQKISDPPLKTCSECGGEVKKLVSASAFHLKGGGWYADGYSSGGSCKEGGTTKEPPACQGGSCPGCPSAS
ncbi:MAG: FmdB family zinc ribbon protein [Candidatus Electronema sp. V4]|uniref:FmdB family zinc ribbon protein n=1 Tax=Candidatus Electronema sp. V4 TaxID=3454756 RepID=UPI00405596DA